MIHNFNKICYNFLQNNYRVLKPEAVSAVRRPEVTADRTVCGSSPSAVAREICSTMDARMPNTMLQMLTKSCSRAISTSPFLLSLKEKQPQHRVTSRLKAPQPKSAEQRPMVEASVFSFAVKLCVGVGCVERSRQKKKKN